MSSRLRSLVARVTALAALALAVTAQAGIDVEVCNGDKVTGTLNPASQVETVRAMLPAGARLTVTTKGLRKSGKHPPPAPVVTFRVLDPGDNEVVAFRPTRGTGASLKNFLIKTSGDHRIEVRGDGVKTGDYLLTVAWASRRTFAITGDLADGTFDDPFEADVGARATILVKAARGSPAHPKISRVHDFDGAFDRSFTAPAAGATKHKVSNVTLPGGRLYIEVADTDGSLGRVTGSVVLTPPAPVRRSVVVTDAKLGGGGDGSAIGVVLGREGGTIEVEATVPGIEGASIEIPGGALKLPTAIIVGTSKDLTAAAGRRPAGPAVSFGPEGLTFVSGKPALITLPFDPAAAQGDPSKIEVRVRDAKGKVRTMVFGDPQPIVDLGEGLITFETQHFTSFQAFTSAPEPAVRGDLDGDGFGDLVIPAPARNSGTGRVYVFRGGPTLASGPATGADLILDGAGADDEFGRDFLVADLDGDGTDDLAVSGRTPHRVAIWFGGSSFLAGGAPDVTLTGASPDVNFGIRLAAADLGGDSKLDLIVGDEDSTRTVAVGGAAFVFFGPIASNELSTDADVILAGEATGDLFGAAVAAGDVLAGLAIPDDGRADLVVGADQADNPGNGKVYVFRGPLAAGARGAATADVILTGETSGDGFGLQIAVADVDGGGRAELIAASALFDGPGPTSDLGKAYVFRGEDGIATGSAATAQASIVGLIAGDQLGTSLRAGDVLGDSNPEVLVGIGRWTIPGTFSGAVAILDSITTTAVTTRQLFEGVTGQQVGEFGLPPTDVNGDGRADLVLVGHRDMTGGLRAGAVFVYFGGAAALVNPAPVSGANVIITGAPDEQLGGRD